MAKMKTFEGTNTELDRAILQSVEDNHIWLNALQCINPTDEFCQTVGREVIRMAMDRRICLPSRVGEPEDKVSDLSNLTPTIYLRVNAS